jgi:hypothetical protein
VPDSSGDGGFQPVGPDGSMSPIEFRLDATSGAPTYLQLVHQWSTLRLGYLKPSDHLPNVRDVIAPQGYQD